MDSAFVGYMLDQSVDDFIRYMRRAYPAGVSHNYMELLLYEQTKINYNTLPDFLQEKIDNLVYMW